MSTEVVPTVAFSGAAIHGVIVVRAVWEVEVRLQNAKKRAYIKYLIKFGTCENQFS